MDEDSDTLEHIPDMDQAEKTKGFGLKGEMKMKLMIMGKILDVFLIFALPFCVKWQIDHHYYGWAAYGFCAYLGFLLFQLTKGDER